MSALQSIPSPREYFRLFASRLAAVLDLAGSAFLWLALNWKAILLNLIVLPVMAIVYWTVSSMGLRLLVDIFSYKLYRIVGFSWMRHYYGLRDIDLGNVCALGLLLFVWVFTLLAMHVWCCGGLRKRGLNERFVNSFVVSVAIALTVADGTLFFRGIGEQMLLTSGFSAMQVIITLAYSISIYGLAFLHCLLEHR